MAKKQLLEEQVMPTPLSPIATGDAKADAAIAALAALEMFSSDPRTRPYGKDYDKLAKVAKRVDPKKLLPLLDDAACAAGAAVYDEDRLAKLSPAKRKEVMKAYDAAGHARKARHAYLDWLMTEVLPDGYDRVAEIATSDKYAPGVREIAIRVLHHHDDGKRYQKEVASLLDAHDYGKDTELERVYQYAMNAWHAADPKAAYDRHHALLEPAALKQPGGKARADIVITSVYSMREHELDRRWAAALAPLVGDDQLDVIASMALEGLPADPVVIDPILARLGKPEAVTYWPDLTVKVLARVANDRVAPYLVRALADKAEHHVDKILDRVDKKLAKSIRAQIAEAPAEAEPARERPTLVYKKIKPFKKPKLLPLAKQRAQIDKLFDDAKLAKGKALVQQAVVMIPRRVEESKLAVGATKLGGHPDLPANVEWPRVKKAPLTFLAQLHLADFAPHLPKDAPLPKAGHLAFFVDNDAQNPDGEYLQNARVIYTKPKTKLARREVPDDFLDVIYQACSVELVPKLSMPSPSHPAPTKLFTEAERDVYSEDVFVSLDALPQLLGYRDHGYDLENPITAQMLLQLTGDDQSDMEFGDADYLAFFIDKKKLAKGDFSKVWPYCGD